jgi:HD superfamily phosphohydrolase YqeK
MTALQKVVFIADKVEGDKLARDRRLQSVADLAETDLDAAMLAYLDLYVQRGLELGWPLHSHTVAARNELLSTRRVPEEVAEQRGAESAEA